MYDILCIWNASQLRSWNIKRHRLCLDCFSNVFWWQCTSNSGQNWHALSWRTFCDKERPDHLPISSINMYFLSWSQSSNLHTASGFRVASIVAKRSVMICCKRSEEVLLISKVKESEIVPRREYTKAAFHFHFILILTKRLASRPNKKRTNKSK